MMNVAEHFQFLDAIDISKIEIFNQNSESPLFSQDVSYVHF